MHVLHTTASFTIYFPSIQRSAQKKVFPSTLRISKFLFSIPDEQGFECGEIGYDCSAILKVHVPRIPRSSNF